MNLAFLTFQLRLLLCLTVLGQVLFSHTGYACTAFAWSQGTDEWVGKSFDFDLGHGALMVNKRNVRKHGLRTQLKGIPVRWVAKYGSVTFNQLGRKFPFGGMNEKGLVVETLWLSETKYETNTKKPTINESEYVQYILDKAVTIEDVKLLTRSIQIASIMAPVHFFSCERSGRCLIVEFLDGKASFSETSYDDPTRPRFVSNSPYATKANLKESLDLFDHLQSTQATVIDKDLIFSALDAVKEKNWTRWQIAYNQTALKVYFRSTSAEAVKFLDLKSLNYSCLGPTETIEISESEPGDISSRLRPGSYAQDRKNILIFAREFSLPNILVVHANLHSATSLICEDRKAKGL